KLCKGLRKHALSYWVKKTSGSFSTSVGKKVGSMKRSLVAALVLLLALGLSAQEFRGTITGAISDATGAQIAGAKVTVTEINTNTRTETVTDASGHYTAPFLLPGDYDVLVSSPGFKDSVRRAIHVGAGDHPVIDLKLDVGDSKQTIEVTADVPLVNS